mmetsp:Transcript_36126/g.71014  ORF Transcript_36126/g.71014 Transcript_36126/m.71014 type:complete len:276 (-) Transcript_36126:163-990(-)|eukprot:CAMPEP_0175144738 /NCGR_PEP_ID=MMETSP0087-20121206/14324_1 /TAXON_ID=136419 /ORGANISM="Unknown Unknown, Strain D1" /LENGTH=275 /DNA_ID=CAMNT_0016429291 /DNA_START=9 /DNA_END=836 /DNA_ORIENTATION=+
MYNTNDQDEVEQQSLLRDNPRSNRPPGPEYVNDAGFSGNAAEGTRARPWTTHFHARVGKHPIAFTLLLGVALVVFAIAGGYLIDMGYENRNHFCEEPLAGWMSLAGTLFITCNLSVILPLLCILSCPCNSVKFIRNTVKVSSFLFWLHVVGGLFWMGLGAFWAHKVFGILEHHCPSDMVSTVRYGTTLFWFIATVFIVGVLFYACQRPHFRMLYGTGSQNPNKRANRGGPNPHGPSQSSMRPEGFPQNQFGNTAPQQRSLRPSNRQPMGTSGYSS